MFLRHIACCFSEGNQAYETRKRYAEEKGVSLSNLKAEHVEANQQVQEDSARSPLATPTKAREPIPTVDSERLGGSTPVRVAPHILATPAAAVSLSMALHV